MRLRLLTNLLLRLDETCFRFQVDLAAEAGAQSIRALCSAQQTPVTKNCAGLLAKITAAVQSTSLATNVTVQSGYPLEGYYCVSSSGGLQLVGSTGTIGAPPQPPSQFDCSTYGRANSSPADYVQVGVSYAYTPLFTGVSVASLLPSPITRTAWYRAF